MDPTPGLLSESLPTVGLTLIAVEGKVLEPVKARLPGRLVTELNCYQYSGFPYAQTCPLQLLSSHGTLKSLHVRWAKLGRYLARAKNPPPGNMVLWRELTRLTDIHLGFELRNRVVCN